MMKIESKGDIILEAMVSAEIMGVWLLLKDKQGSFNTLAWMFSDRINLF